jgi:hypothetical protein
VPRAAIQKEVLAIMGMAAPDTDTHCKRHEGIDPWPQQRSQHCSSETVKAAQASVAGL